jgi:hypothetical protein
MHRTLVSVSLGRVKLHVGLQAIINLTKDAAAPSIAWIHQLIALRISMAV